MSTKSKPRSESFLVSVKKLIRRSVRGLWSAEGFLGWPFQRAVHRWWCFLPGCATTRSSCRCASEGGGRSASWLEYRGFSSCWWTFWVTYCLLPRLYNYYDPLNPQRTSWLHIRVKSKRFAKLRRLLYTQISIEDISTQAVFQCISHHFPIFHVRPLQEVYGIADPSGEGLLCHGGYGCQRWTSTFPSGYPWTHCETGRGQGPVRVLRHSWRVWSEALTCKS